MFSSRKRPKEGSPGKLDKPSSAGKGATAASSTGKGDTAARSAGSAGSAAKTVRGDAASAKKEAAISVLMPERIVKVAWDAGAAPSEYQLRARMSEYGDVQRIGCQPQFALVCFFEVR